MENKEDIIDIDPVLILKRVLKYAWVIIAMGIIFGVAAYMWSSIMIVPKYKSSTKVYVLNNNMTDKKLTTQDFQVGNYLLKDYKEIILSSKVLEKVIEKNGVKDNVGQLRTKIEVKIPQDTRILTITVEDINPKIAADLANDIARLSATKLLPSFSCTEVITITLIFGPLNCIFVLILL